MKNKIFSILLAAIMLLCASISVSALDAPTPGGDHLFGPDRMMYYEPGTRWHNGIANGAVPHPTNPGTFATWQGVKFLTDTYKGERCVKVELCDGMVTGYFDFNYYQWDATEYEPSLDCSKYPYLRVRYAYNSAAADIDCMGFFASPDVTVLGTAEGAAQKTWDIANGEGEWVDTVIYLGDLMFVDGKTWAERTVRQFRIKMFEYNEVPEAVCYIAGFGFFESQEAAMAYDFQSGTSSLPAVTEQTETEPVTQAVSEKVTETVTQAPVTEKATEATEAETEVNATVEDTTANEEDTTIDSEEASDETESTQATTEADTVNEATTPEQSEEASESKADEEETEAASPEAEPETEKNSVILPIAVVAAIVVIAIIAIVILKKKKA